MRISTKRSNLLFGKFSSSKVRMLALILPAILFSLGAQVSHAQITASIDVTQEISCTGDGDGQLTAVAVGGTGTYTYAWNTGVTNDLLSGIPAGTYTVTITDAGNPGDSDVATLTLQDPPDLAATIIVNQQITCFNACNGEIEIVVDATDTGTPPYTYAWGTSSVTTALRQNMCAGAFSAVVHDANGCEADPSPTVVLSNPAKINIFESVTDVNCFGADDGAISVSLGIQGGGFPPFTYTWTATNGYTNSLSGNNFAGSITGIGPGDYTLVVQDANNCQSTEPAYTVLEPAGMTITATPTPVNCFGAFDGSIDLTVTGNGAFQYSWSGPNAFSAITEDISAIEAGDYTVTVTDANGCTQTETTTVGAAFELIVTDAITDLTCNGVNVGEVALTTSGGSAPYSYLWSNGGTLATISSLAGGTYTVTITDQAGCISNKQYTVLEPSTINIVQSITDVLCFGLSTGAIDLTVSGGTQFLFPAEPYNYAWATGETTEDLSALAAGSYEVTVTDANGCTATEAYTVDQPTAVLSATIAGSALNCAGDNDGTVTVVTSGGTSPYTYLWSSGESSESITAKVAGTYTLSITDDNACELIVSDDVTEPAALTLSGVETGLSCNSTNDGSIVTTVGGGTGAYTYLWTGPSITVANENNANLTALAPGTYAVTVEDVNGCSINDSWIVSQPVAITVSSEVVTDVACNGELTGSISFVAAGGVAPLTVNWSNGATGETINGLAAGTYTATISDASTPACELVSPYIVNEPGAALSASINPVALTCYGDDGTIPLDVSGGTGPFTYLWSQGGTTQVLQNQLAGTYTVTVTDANLCTVSATGDLTQPAAYSLVGAPVDITCFGANDGSIATTVAGGTGAYTYFWTGTSVTGLNETDASLASLEAGAYAVTVKDANLCELTDTWTITEPTEIVIGAATIVDVDCNGALTGSISLSATGGVLPLTYSWNGGTYTGASISGLGQGQYDLVVSDASIPACTATMSYIVNEPSAALTASINPVALTCYGDDGTIPLDVSGGTGPFTYLWSQGGTTQVLQNQLAGTYTVTVTDVNGCTVSTSGDLTQPAEYLLSGTPTDITCNGADDGTIATTVVGGTGAYTYFWTGPSVTALNETDANLNALAAGTYAVTVKDANLCELTDDWTIAEPVAITVSLEVVTDVACNGELTGAISFVSAGGVAPRTVTWSNGDTGESITGLAAGAYTATITDATSCTLVLQYVVAEPGAALTASINPAALACYGATGSIPLDVQGGTQYPIVNPGDLAYDYSWNTGSSDPNLSAQPAGTYTVLVTDANGCTVSATGDLTQPAEYLLTAVAVDASCNGADDGTIATTVVGGTAPYIHLWTGASITALNENNVDLTGLAPDTYTLNVSDANGCQLTDNWTINEPSAITVSATISDYSGFGISFFGNNDGTIDLLAGGGTAPLTVAWTGPTSYTSTDFNLSNLYAGTYFYTVTDASATGPCIVTGSVVLNEPGGFTVSYDSQVDVLCNGFSTGSINVTVDGGVAPYTYAWEEVSAPGVVVSTIEDPTGLPAGEYSVTVTDANAVTTVLPATVTLTQPLLLDAWITPEDITCNGLDDGYIQVNVVPGTGTAPYTFKWYADPNPSIFFFEETDPLTSTTNNNLTAGNYGVKIVDANGCFDTWTAPIVEPAPIVITTTSISSFSANNYTIECYGFNNGSISVSVSGGVPPYTYAWGNGLSTTPTNNNIGIPTSVLSYSYGLTVEDADQCEQQELWNITQPAAISATATVVSDVSCNGLTDGAADVTVSTPGTYTYSWNSAPFVANSDVNGLAAGNYCVVVKDDITGCSAYDTGSGDPALPASWNFTITDEAHTFIIPTAGVTIGGEALQAGDYIGAFTPAGVCAGYTMVTGAQTIVQAWRDDLFTTNPTPVEGFVDGELVNWRVFRPMVDDFPIHVQVYTNPGSNAILFDHLATTEVVSLASNSAYPSSELCVVIAQPDVLVTSTAASADVSCFNGNNGSIDIDIVGGTAPYTISWNGVAPLVFTSSDEDLTNLVAGTYEVDVVDVNGCVAATHSVTIAQPTAMTFSAVISNYNTYGVSCFGGDNGSIDLTVSGGTMPYVDYDWSDNISFSAGTEDLMNLEAGSYIVTVTDANGCTDQATFAVTEPADAVTLSGVIADVDCAGADNGSITVTYSGGLSPYTFAWADGSTIVGSRTGLAGGVYDLTITDNNGCTTTNAYTVAEPSAITIVAVTSDFNTYGVSCPGALDGTVDLTVTGGTPGVPTPYTFDWSNGQTTEDLSGLAENSYTVTVTDDNACTMVETVQLVAPTAIAITVDNVINVSCNGGANGLIDISVVGGVPALTYSWTGPNGFTSVNDDINALEAGVYDLVITDANGCTAMESVTITDPAAMVITETLSVYGIYNISCAGINDGSISLSMAGGVGPYTYAWTGPNAYTATGSLITGLAVGSYDVTVTDANACTVTGTYFILGPDELVVKLNSTPVSCNGLADGIVFGDIQGGAGTYNYTLYNDLNAIEATGSVAISVSGLTAGMYHVEVVDGNGCVSTAGDAGVLPADWNYTINSAEHTMLLTDANAAAFNIAGTNLQVGDYIGAFYIDPVSTNLECAGYAVWNGVNTAITIWEDELLTTPADKDGYTPGDSFMWQVYRPTYGVLTANATYEAVAGPITAAGVFVSGGISSLADLDTDLANFNTTDVTYVEVIEPEVLVASLSAANIQCMGGTTEIISSFTGGNDVTPGYSWSTGETTANITVTGGAPATYTVTVTDSKGCSDVQSINVTDPAQLVVSATTIDVHCFGLATGSATFSAVGGYAPYTFAVNAADAGALIAGDYTVTVTDAEGCTDQLLFTIAEPVELTTSGVVTDVECNGDFTGSIDLSYAGGTGAVTFDWTGPNTFASTSEDISLLEAGTYNVEITDANGCIATNSFTVAQPDQLVITETIEMYDVYNVSCNGGNDGQISLAVTGGTAPYTYTWDIPASTAVVSGLVAGVYNVTVKDIYNCEVIGSYTINEPPAVAAVAVITSNYIVGSGVYNTTCNGFDGSVDLSVTGGVAPYTYAWDNGYTTGNISGIPAGDYSVTVTDAFGCTAESNVVSLTGPGPINVTATVTSQYNGFNLRCNGDDNAEVDLTWTGGEAPYDIYWSNWNGDVFFDNADNTFSFPTDYSAPQPGMGAGTYWAVVIDANGCAQLSNQFDVTEPDAFDPLPGVTATSCFGGNDGVIDLSGMTGGVPPYTFQWDLNANWSTSDVLTGLPAGGSYYCVVWDFNNCSEGYQYVIDQPTEIVITNIATSTPDCFGAENGSIDLTVTGGTPGALGYLFSAQSTSHTYTNVASLDNIFAGTYSVTVMDDNMCEKVLTGITVDNAPDFSIGIDLYGIQCFGGAADSLLINVTTSVVNPAPGPFTYSWSGPNAYASTDQNLYGLAPGTYTVEITSGAGCVKSFPIDIVEPTQMSIAPTYTDVTCFGGNDGGIDIVVTGGTADPVGSYLYAWNVANTGDAIANLPAGDYNLTVVDNNNCEVNTTLTISEPNDFEFASSLVTDVTCNGLADGAIDLVITGGTAPYSNFVWTPGGMTTEDVSGLSAGVYDVAFTDANGCAGATSITVGEANVLAANVDLNNISCVGLTDGSLEAMPSGGTAPYTYSWSNGPTTALNSGLVAGAYTVTVTDANTCTVEQTVTVVEPAVISFTKTVADATCTLADGQININAISGGTVMNPTNYVIEWADFPGSGNAVQFNLVAGDYEVTISDLNGCSITETIVVTSLNSMTASVTEDMPSCNGLADGMLTAVVSGTAPYTYSWNAAAAGTDVSIAAGAGAYTLVVEDNIGCQTTVTGTLAEPTAVTASVLATNETCTGDANAFVEVTAGGGTAGYTYEWSNLETTAIISGAAIVPGNYSVVVTDANGCTATANDDVEAVLPLDLNLVATDVACDGDATGNVDLTVTGGTSPYTYSWAPILPIITTEDLTNVENGTYSVFVQDANGCFDQASATVDAGFTFDFVSEAITDVACNQGSDGQIIVNFTNEHYTFEWFDLNGSMDISPNQISDTITGLLAGAYQLQITSFPVATCMETRNYTINEPLAIDVAETITNVNCYKGNDGAIDLVVSGGTSPYTYQWTNGANNIGSTQNIANIKKGTYKVLVTDANGCQMAPNFVVAQPTLLQINTILENDITCNGLTDGFVEVVASGGTPGYGYEWFDGSNTSISTATSISALGVDDYDIVVTDGNGCFALATYSITQPTALAATVVINQNGDIECNGDTDGAVHAEVSGGTFPYTFEWNTTSTNDYIENLAAGFYDVTVNDANGCDVVSDITLVDPAALVVDLIENTPTTLLADITSVGTPGYTYEWIYNGNPLTGLNLQQINNLGLGAYSVTVEDANGCIATDNHTVTAPAPVDGDNGSDDTDSPAVLDNALNNIANQVNVYPNPNSTGHFFIDLGKVNMDNSQIQVLDGLGRVIESMKLANEMNELVELQIPAAKGVYYLRIITEGYGSVTKQLIITE